MSTVAEHIAVPSTSNEISEEDKKKATIEALNLLAQGKRNLLCQEIPTAVDQLQEASKLLADAFGETSQECADVYLTYGQALLELARMENTVLGNALQGVPSEEEGELSADDQFEKTDDIKDDERLELRKTVSEALSTVDEKGEQEASNKQKVSPNESDEAKDDTTEATESTSQESEDATQLKEGTKPEDDEDQESNKENEELEEEDDEDESMEEEDAEEGETENPDDISNLQLAWEVLELARIIYLREEESKMRLKAADACMLLGEISLETEEYEKAIEDIVKCLDLQKEHQAEDRTIAKTYYQLALACLLNTQHHQALKHLETAVFCIKSKIEKLKGVTDSEGKEENDIDNPVQKAKQEIKELQEILPEICAKIEDVKEEMKSYDAVKAMAKEAFSNAIDTIPAFQSSDKVENSTAGMVQNINHIVRKKRKPEDEEASTNEDKAKKSRPDTTEAPENGVKSKVEETAMNGNVVTNGDVNSDHSPTFDNIKVKTVEDVKRTEEMETSEPESTT